MPCGRREAQTHVAKVIVAFCSFENEPKISAFYPTCYNIPIKINRIKLQAFMTDKQCITVRYELDL